MLYIVDGTGDFSDTDYAVSMAGSHCAVLHHLNKQHSFYFRGPDLLSAIKSTGGTAQKVFQKVMQEEFPPAFLAPGQRQQPRSPIFLAGHSRGGAAVVRVAQLLAEKNFFVDGMFLFDAVDRTVLLDSVQVVPWNVLKCYHAVRNEGAEMVMSQEVRALWKRCEQAPGFEQLRKEFRRAGSGAFEPFLMRRSAMLRHQWPALATAVQAWSEKLGSLGRLQVAMRNSFGIAATTDGKLEASIPFGNCARRFDAAVKHEVAEFACSHGAIGGTPWTNLGEEVAKLDRDGSARVWTWMASRINHCGLRAGRVA
ncbi:MAG: hypothetical protein KF683_24210 [Rubrivivax sp.]|nr:hypothetical protein [Rubrivivax sp.]